MCYRWDAGEVPTSFGSGSWEVHVRFVEKRRLDVGPNLRERDPVGQERLAHGLPHLPPVRCVSATELAELVARGTACQGFSSICTLY